jgi:hypothetical protein
MTNTEYVCLNRQNVESVRCVKKPLPGQQGSYTVEASLPAVKGNNDVDYSSVPSWGPLLLAYFALSAILRTGIEPR